MHHELRSYDLVPERQEAFHARFRDHTLRLFARHGFTPLQVWTGEQDGRPRLLYLLEWPDDATRERAWQAFLADPEWLEVKQRSEAGLGPLFARTEGLVLRPADYGPRLQS